MMAAPYAVQRSSCNRKLAPQRQDQLDSGWRRNVPIGPFVTSTYVSIEKTCPSTCTFKGNGCYVQAGPSKVHAETLDAVASVEGWTALEIIRAEARAIDRLWLDGVPQDGAKGGRDLRLHVGGDVSCARGAAALGEAAHRWRSRAGGQVWTYTHRWRSIAPAAWGPWVSVLASCDRERDVAEAWEIGYTPAVLVREFPRGPKAFRIGKLTAIPCPVEAGARTTCATCRLCMHDLRLRADRHVIAFAEHGPQAGTRRLPVLRGAA